MPYSEYDKYNDRNYSVVALEAHLGMSTPPTVLCEIKQWEILNEYKDTESRILLNTNMCKNCIYHFSNKTRENNCMGHVLKIGLK